MKSVIAVVAGVLLLVSTSLAASSVKLPKGFVMPENVALNGRVLYETIANSLNTLPRNADLSRVATMPPSEASSLVGSSAKQRAVLFVLPEALAPTDSISVKEIDDFPLEEMSRTFSTALVLPGTTYEMRDAFAPRSFRKIYTPREMDLDSLITPLTICGSNLIGDVDEKHFYLNDADFVMTDVKGILSTAAAICSYDPEEQITVVDFHSSYDYIIQYYGEKSHQVEALKKMIDGVMETMKRGHNIFVLSTDINFFEMQVFDSDYVAVPPTVSANTKFTTTQIVSSPSTGHFQITLWFTIFIVLVVMTVAVLTCGVGVDIEKDTLLYQTTCLRGQPVL